jgi:hypothetical protein
MPQEVRVERGAELPVIELRPVEQPRLMVELDCPDGKPLTALEVRFAPLEFGVSNAAHFDGAKGTSALVERKGKGGMTSEPLAVGPYVVGVFVAGKLVATTRADVTDPPTSQRVTLPGPNEADGIVCTVVLPAQHRDKQPNFSIAWGGSGEEFESPVKFEEVWDLGEQRYFLQVRENMRGNVGPTLWVSVPGLGLVRKRIARASGVATVEFLPAGRLRVEVLNVPEALRRRILLEVNSGDLARPTNAGHVGYDADAGVSVQQWELIQPGSITLSIYIERDGPVLATTTLDLPAGGDEKVSLNLPSLFELAVNRIDRSIDGASLYEGVRDGRLIRQLKFDKGDAVVVSYLPAGTYTIRYRVKREDHERKVAVDGDTTIHLRS